MRHKITDIDVEQRNGICSVCGPVGIWKATHKDRLRWRCKTYLQEVGRKSRRRQKYGVEDEEFIAKLESQNGLCAGGCGRPGTHQDHNHITGDNRGILCHKCNVSLGMADDSLEQMKRLVDYLERYQ